MQNWLDPDAEYARSNFDQRHLVTASVEHTTGVGVRGGTLIDGWKGRLLKDWTFTATFSAGSGLPLTPIYFAPVGGTGIVGSIRPDTTGLANTPPPGAYANPEAFAAPAPGHWGSASRNSITGPSTFTLNAGVTRTFRLNSRLNESLRIIQIAIMVYSGFGNYEDRRTTSHPAVSDGDNLVLAHRDHPTSRSPSIDLDSAAVCSNGG